MDIENSSNEKSYEVTINIPEKVRKRLPDDFNIDDIGNIDLQEAEIIANEDVLFLTESDLIEGLEDFDLIPLKESKEAAVPSEDEMTDSEVGTLEMVSVEVEDVEDRVSDLRDQEPVYEDSVKWVPLEEIDSDNEDDIKWMPLEKVDYKEVELEEVELEEVELEEVELEEVELEEVELEEVELEEVELEEVELEEVELEEVELEEVELEEVELKEVKDEEYESSDNELDQEEKERSEEIITCENEIVCELTLDDLDGHVEYLESVKLEYKEDSASIGKIGEETLADDLHEVDISADGVSFIDDEVVKKEIVESGSIFEESELEKITSDIVALDKGESLLIQEAGIEEDRGMIVSAGFVPSYEEGPPDIDEEYRYIDDELDFIHATIVEEDYVRYIKEIDDFHSLKRGVSTAVEILGLTVDEIDTIEDMLFAEDYKDVNLYEIFDFFGHEISRSDKAIKKNCTYIMPGPSSLLDFEKESIENDISSGNAIIFEENVEEIKEQLRKKARKTSNEFVEVVDTVFDITDRVVILEDEDDVSRFVKEFPEEKRFDIRMLLKYLDGLFEKLPENLIRKFAGSEYFELYLKVLNELGV